MISLLLSALGFVLIYNLLFFQTGVGLGTGVIFLLFNLFFYYFRDRNSRNQNLSITFSIVSVLFASLLSFRSNDIIQILNFILAVFFSLIAQYFYKSSQPFSFKIPDFILIPLSVISDSISNGFKFLTSGKLYANQPKSEVSVAVTRGVIIALPIIAILLMLLTSADPVFSFLVEKFLENIWQRILISVLIFSGLITFGITRFGDRWFKQKEETNQEVNHKVYELTVILASIGLLFGVFIFVQFNYFFSNIGERELHQLGVKSLTYSEYVRKGFFELLAACSIASLVMIYVIKYLHRLKEGRKLIVQLLSTIIVIEIGLLLLSAAQRVNLYQLAHGLTRARIFGFIFLVWLSMILIILLLRTFKNLSKQVVFGLGISLTVLTVFFLSFLDIDGMIATKYKPSVNGQVDYYYLANLSPDAYLGWEEAMNDSRNIIINLNEVKSLSSEQYRQLFWARLTLSRLDSHIKYLEDRYKSPKWQPFNLSESDAYNYVRDNQIFREVPRLLEKANEIEINKVDNTLRQMPFPLPPY